MDWKKRIFDRAKKEMVRNAKNQLPEQAKQPFDEAKELASDVKDATKVASQAATGNWAGAAITAIKNRRMRRMIIALLVIVAVFPVVMVTMIMTLIIGEADMFQHPMMNFSPQQTIMQTNPDGTHTMINFNTLANRWTKTIRWGTSDQVVGLTQAEIDQVNQLQLNLSYGLLETFYEIGVRQGASNPNKTMNRIVELLQPSEIDFKPVQLRKVKDVQTKKGTVKEYDDVTEMVLQNITRYNGYWATSWHVITESDGSQIVVFGPSTLQRKDYTPLYRAEKAFNFLHNQYDQQMLFGQFLVLDANFYDPNALPVLQMLEGGSISSSGGAPSNGAQMPKPQIIAIIQQAIQIDRVPESWLSGLEIIVGHEDASGNPSAVDPILVDGEHASGLMQMLPSTFWSDHVNGYNNIWNPLDNAVAAIRHIEGAWESPYNIPGVVSGVYKGY